MTCKQRSERGFTVVELLTVIAIMMVIMAIAMPTFYYWLPTYRLSAGARQIAADLQLARMKAISQNTSYHLNFLTSSTYRFEKDTDNNGTPEDPESGPFTLPEGITVAATGVTSIFQSRGTANTGVGIKDISLTNGDANKAVCMETVGRVHIEESTADC